MEYKITRKDKEVEKLIQTLKIAGETIDYCEDITRQQIRHQVCEEIREKLKLNYVLQSSYTATSVDALYLSLVLDQIEKGE